jgi:hypothetical protein
VSDQHGFVSHAWLGRVPVALWALLAATAGWQVTVSSGLHPAVFLVLSMAIGLTAIQDWVGSRPNVSRAHLRSVTRRIALLQGAVGAVAAGALAVTGYAGNAILCAVAGLLFLAVCWPWERTLRRQEQERVRHYRADYFVLQILAGLGVTAVAVVFVATGISYQPDSADSVQVVVTSSLSLFAVMLALAMQSFLLAWDERRRPRRPSTPVTGRPTAAR